jgi:hypothetical protein
MFVPTDATGSESLANSGGDCQYLSAEGAEEEFHSAQVVSISSRIGV